VVPQAGRGLRTLAGLGDRVTSCPRLFVAIAVLTLTFVVPAGSPAHALDRCSPLVGNVKTNSLQMKAGGPLLVEYRLTVRWCTAPDGSVQARVYSPLRSRSHRVTAAGILAGWTFDRVLSEKRGYYTYQDVPYGGYYVKARVNFVRCQLLSCTNESGWLNTYVRYNRTAAAAHDWDR
jgi:hypothetical protein